jgi:hypothetical protein
LLSGWDGRDVADVAPSAFRSTGVWGPVRQQRGVAVTDLESSILAHAWLPPALAELHTAADQVRAHHTCA